MMENRYNHNGLPSNLINYDCNGVGALSVEEGTNFRSTPTTFNGDVVGKVLVRPDDNCRLKLKAITIIGEGNVGSVKVFRSSNNEMILPAYFSRNNPFATSSSFNMVLEENEYIYATSELRADNEVFIGVSYIQLKEGVV